MPIHRLTAVPMLLVAAGGLVVGLALPAAGHEASHLISGSSIKAHSIAGNRLQFNTVTGKQVKESTLGAVPRAKSLPALVWHPIKLENNWVDGSIATPAYRSPAYAIDAQGQVHLRGTLAGGISGTFAFVLPRAASPKPGLVLGIPMLVSGGKAGQLIVTSKGDAPGPGDATSDEVTDLSVLEGIVFDPR